MKDDKLNELFDILDDLDLEDDIDIDINELPDNRLNKILDDIIKNSRE